VKDPRYASLWLPLPKRQTFTYRIPESESLAIGQCAIVPLGRRKVVGLVESLNHEAPAHLSEIKTISEILPEEFSLSPHLLKLLRWASDHYLSPPGEVLRTFIPNAIFKGKKHKGERSHHPSSVHFFADDKNLQLNSAQKEAVDKVSEKLGGFHPALLQGVTGSGKTEVYLQLCAEVLRREGSTLLLVPEIALTPQIMARFVSRFGELVTSYHSGMTEGQRLKTWWAVKEGVKRVVIGTRSAIGLPVQKLGLIIVDEEHDSSYKQEERFRYHGRDLAVVRAKLESVPVLLGSATPSLESMENVRRQKYERYTLSERATQGSLPKIHLIDLKSNPPHPETSLSEPLEECLKATMERGEQAMLFLNRRGYAPFILCQDCGEVPRCPNCEISLTFHKRGPELKCHYCEFHIPPPSQCGTCQGLNLEPIGLGTEKIEAELQKAFPKMRLGRLDRDVVQSRLRTEEILSQFGNGEIDVLVGTQLITKGHDFKNLTLVGILSADLALHLPDFRAAEKMFQLITQVAGRAGRHDLPGQVFLQTYRPEHFAIQAAMGQDPEHFFVQERSQRELACYPPFSRLVLLRLMGTKDENVESASHALAEDLKSLFRKFSGTEILGPSKATLEKLRGKFRWQIMLRTTRYEAMRKTLGEKLPQLEAQLPPGTQLTIDVDPVGMM